MESTLLFFALPQEAAAFVKLGRRRGWPLRPTTPPVPRSALQRFIAPGLEVWVTGMGPENALRSGDAALETGRPDRVFTCGDMRRGQSLVVWAIREGRQCARAVDEALMGVSELPR